MHMVNLMLELEKLDIKIFYKDTDSLYTDKAIPDKFISSTKLGLLKLEYQCVKAIFLAPKVYCLEIGHNNFIYKVKGLTKQVELTINDFNELLKLNSVIEKNQSKWFKSLIEGSITIKDQIYTLKATNNKRQLIYDNNNILTSTKPYILSDNKIINTPIHFI